MEKCTMYSLDSLDANEWSVTLNTIPLSKADVRRKFTLLPGLSWFTALNIVKIFLSYDNEQQD